MTRMITTAAELDALPVGSVVLGADLPDVPRRPLGERISPRRDPDARWNVDGRHYYGATETVLAVLGGAATVLHDPPGPAPAPSVVPEAAVEALDALVEIAKVGLVGSVRQRVDDLAKVVRAALTAAPSEVERIARALTETTALTGADALRIVQAAQAMSAPSATRDEVARAVDAGIRGTTDGDLIDADADIPAGEAVRLATDALLARFTITPKEDR